MFYLYIRIRVYVAELGPSKMFSEMNVQLGLMNFRCRDVLKNKRQSSGICFELQSGLYTLGLHLTENSCLVFLTFLLNCLLLLP